MRDIKSSFVTNFYLKISKTNFLANFFFSFSSSTSFERRFVRSAEICVINIHTKLRARVKHQQQIMQPWKIKNLSEISLARYNGRLKFHGLEFDLLDE